MAVPTIVVLVLCPSGTKCIIIIYIQHRALENGVFDQEITIVLPMRSQIIPKHYILIECL